MLVHDFTKDPARAATLSPIVERWIVRHPSGEFILDYDYDDGFQFCQSASFARLFRSTDTVAWVLQQIPNARAFQVLVGEDGQLRLCVPPRVPELRQPNGNLTQETVDAVKSNNAVYTEVSS